MVTGDGVEISLRWLIRGTSEKTENEGDKTQVGAAETMEMRPL